MNCISGNNLILNLFKITFFAFFCLMLITPSLFQYYRLSILLILIFFSLIYSFTIKWQINQYILLWFTFIILLSLSFIYYGILNNNPGAFSQLTVFVIWPLLYLYICGFNITFNFLNCYIFCITLSSFFISSLILLYAVNAFYFNILNHKYFTLFESSHGSYDGFLRVSFTNVSTLLYTLPFLITLSFLPQHLYKPKKKFRYFLFFTILLSLTCMLICGRKGLILSLFTGILLVFLFFNILRIKSLYLKYSIPILIILFLFLSAIFKINLLSFFDYFINGFLFFSNNDLSASIRGEQLLKLTDAFVVSPFFGEGFGATINGYSRSGDQPWAFELFYNSFLFNVGVFGFCLYTFIVFLLFYYCYKICSINSLYIKYLLPSLIASVSFLVANSSNPYLLKFDYLCTLYILPIMINFYLKNNDRYHYC